MFCSILGILTKRDIACNEGITDSDMASALFLYLLVFLWTGSEMLFDQMLSQTLLKFGEQARWSKTSVLTVYQ